jgi:PHP family Zn ribbon phosphoesterase
VSATRLKKFYAANNILDETGGSLRNSPNHIIGDSLVWYRKHPKYAEELVKRSKNKTTTTTTKLWLRKTIPRVNRIRLLNVLFGEAFQQELYSMVRTITRDVTTEGLKNRR